jgi:hypothetical protein
VAVAAYLLGITLATLLACSDSFELVIAALVALVVIVVAAGYRIGRWWALLLALGTLLGALVSDVFWQLEWEPYDRAGEDEPLPATISAILVYAPAAAALLAAGVGARKLSR